MSGVTQALGHAGLTSTFGSVGISLVATLAAMDGNIALGGSGGGGGDDWNGARLATLFLRTFYRTAWRWAAEWRAADGLLKTHGDLQLHHRHL